MADTLSFCIHFSDITVRFRVPSAAQLPEALTRLLCEDTGEADAEYEIRLLSQPLQIASSPVYRRDDILIYRTKEGWLRIYPLMSAEDGCQVACLLRPNGKHTLFYPTKKWHFYSHPFSCVHLLGCELMLLRQRAFLLHSSVVLINGKTVLFSGPSGAGKSTQAGLWEKHLGAHVLNGDRCVIMKKDDGFYGGGSPWSGTSGIYHPEQAPIAGIFLVHQAPVNTVRRLGAAALPPLLGQTLINTWDSDFMEQVTALFADLLGQVPVYRLDCRPDGDAVRTAYNTLF